MLAAFVLVLQDSPVVSNFLSSETPIRKSLVELARNLRTNTTIAFTNT